MVTIQERLMWTLTTAPIANKLPTAKLRQSPGLSANVTVVYQYAHHCLKGSLMPWMLSDMGKMLMDGS